MGSYGELVGSGKVWMLPNRSGPVVNPRACDAASEQPESLLFPRRVSTIYPPMANGADICFVCEAREGGTYYCKTDKDGREIRATEFLSARLSEHVGIPTPFVSVLENDSGATFFGSLAHTSTASEFETRAYLSTPMKDELGRPSGWVGQYLARVDVLDRFLNNPDRSFQNFILQDRKLCAIDFAAVRLMDLSTERFPVEKTPTVSLRSFARKTHGPHPAFAKEMVDRIAGVPIEAIEGFLKEMPADWLTNEQREQLCEIWSGPKLQRRLAALRADLKGEPQL